MSNETETKKKQRHSHKSTTEKRIIQCWKPKQDTNIYINIIVCASNVRIFFFQCWIFHWIVVESNSKIDLLKCMDVAVSVCVCVEVCLNNNFIQIFVYSTCALCASTHEKKTNRLEKVSMQLEYSNFVRLNQWTNFILMKTTATATATTIAIPITVNNECITIQVAGFVSHTLHYIELNCNDVFISSTVK